MKRKNKQKLEEQIQQEIIDRVFDKDSELEEKFQARTKEQAVLDALTELSGLSRERVESIAGEVRSRHEAAAEAEAKKSYLSTYLVIGIIIVGISLPFLAILIPAYLYHMKEQSELEADKLVRAVEQGPVETVDFILRNGGKINAKGSKGRTALMAAAEKRDLEIARFLISRGANVNLTDEGGITALYRAVDREDMQLSRLLLENGADANLRDAPLIRAAFKDNVELMALLLDHGAKTELKRHGKDNCLEMAALHGNIDSVRFLMGKGMSFRYAHDWITDAMMLRAVDSGGFTLVEVFLGRGNDYDKNIEIKLWHKTQKELMDRALKDAAVCGIGEALKPLIVLGADPNDPVADQPLLALINHGDTAAVEYLLDAGADINALHSYHCETPVVRAIRNQNLEIVKLLIERGADLGIELCGYHGNALEWAYAAGGYTGTDEMYLLVKEAWDRQK